MVGGSRICVCVCVCAQCMRAQYVLDRGQLIYYLGRFSAEWSALKMVFSLFFCQFLSLFVEIHASTVSLSLIQANTVHCTHTHTHTHALHHSHPSVKS